MKKFKIALLTAAVSLAAIGFAACGSDSPEPTPGDNSNPTTFSVAFESAWGGSFDTQTVAYGENAIKPSDPVRIGYNFDGWYLNGVLYTFTESVTSDITLVARFSSILGGNGTEADPFTIDTAAELALFKGYVDAGATEFVSAVYVQTTDITSTLTAAVSAFGGVYDGGGYTISTSVPLFDSLTGTVKNLGVSGTMASTAQNAGMLANTADNASITRVTSSGSLENTAGTVGGIVGTLNGGRMEYCSSSADVTGATAGGLAGKSSGTVINSLASGDVSASGYAGGAVGEMSAGALAQNIGFNGTASGSTAGGIVGYKNTDSAVYRGFVYGYAEISGTKAGGIAGEVRTDITKHKDITDCYVTNIVEITGSTVNTYFGQNAVSGLDDLELPSAVWSYSNGVPALKSTPSAFPASVNVRVNSNTTTAAYGSHETRELFTSDDVHFSTLIELDTDVQLKTAMRMHTMFSDKAFMGGSYKLAVEPTGTKLKIGDGAYKDLTYVNTFAHTETLLYTPDYDYPQTAYSVEYDAPVSVYTDGEKYYAFVVEKQQVSDSKYMAFMRSYVLDVEAASGGFDDRMWAVDREWTPESDFSGGAYKYTVRPPLSSPITYMFIIDDAYTVDGKEGYYLTRFVRRVEVDEGEYIESSEVISRGQTVMYLGDSETNAPVTAFFYYVDDEYINFFYRNADGDLVSSEGIELEDATNDFLVGVWFDGTNKYRFNTQNKTVEITNGSDNSTVPYTVENGKIKFTVSTKSYELALAPTEFGSYILKSGSVGDALVLATHISGALDGVWWTTEGDTITVTSDPNAYVVFNGTAAEDVSETIYNNRQALMFTVDNKEYYLIVDGDRGVARLAVGSKTVYAYDKAMIANDFAGEFVSVVDGVRYEITATEDLEFTLTVGDGEAARATTVVPLRLGNNRYALSIVVGSKEYTLTRINDVITAYDSNNNVITYTDAAVFARFVAEYTNGTEMLEITESGKFVRYARGSEKGAYVSLTAGYREERYEYGLEHRGFVLYYTSGEDTMFFYADVDAANIQLYRAWVNSVGNDTASRVTNFVPASELTPIYGSYSRTYNNKPDTLTFGTDGTLKRTYTDEQGVDHVAESIEWYPLLNYNRVTDSTRIIVYTREYSGSTMFESSMDFTISGLRWGFNNYNNDSVASEFLSRFADRLFVGADNSVLSVSADRITITRVDVTGGIYTSRTSTFLYDELTYTSDSVTASMSGAIGNDSTATAVLSVVNSEYKVTLTVDDGAEQQYQEREMADYNDLEGDYAYEGTTYSVQIDRSWFTSITLKIIEGASTTTYNYSESRGVTILNDGTQAFAFTRSIYTKFVWRKGKSLMISDHLDASNAIEATDSFTANMPSVAEIKDKLDKQTFVAADQSEVSFEKTDGLYASYVIKDGDVEIEFDHGSIVDGVYVLYFEESFVVDDTRCVKVYVNDNYDVVKLLIGETDATATKEYFPKVNYPSLEELKDMLLGCEFNTADKTKTISFIMYDGFMPSFSLVLDGDEDNLLFYDNGTKANNVYTMNFSFRTNKTITVILDLNGNVEKIVMDGLDYLPKELPTVNELQTNLDGTTYASADSTITFTMTEGGIFGPTFSFMLDGDDSKTYMFDNGTKSGNQYTLNFSLGFSKMTLTVILKPNGSVEKVIMDGKEYLPVEFPDVDDLLALLSGNTYKAADGDEIEIVEYSNGWFGGVTYSVVVGENEYEYDEGTVSGLVYTLTLSSESDDSQITLIVTFEANGVVQKLTLDGKDYTLFVA